MKKNQCELRVGGLYDARSYVTGWPSVVVSFATHNLDRIRSVRPLALHHDFTIEDTRDALHPLAFQPADAIELLKIGASLKADDQVLVHCAAGVNRSPAAAAALLIGFGLPPSEVWTHVRRVRPIARGNPHMIAEIDIAAGAQRAFWNAWVQDARRTETWAAPHTPVATDQQLRDLVASQVPRKRKQRH